MKNLSLLFIFGSALTFALNSSAETLKFESYEPGDHQGIFSGEWKINASKSKAKFWKSSDSSAPLVVYTPGWGGVDKYLPAFRDIRAKLGDGYHHLFLYHSKNVELAGRTISIYQSIRAAKDKGINPSKIVVIGASGGGQEAMHATHQKTAAALSGGIKIDGVIAFYPSCRVSFEDKSFNNAKILIFVGLKDMVAPAVLCKELKESHGLSHAEIREYPDAGHSWLFKKRKKKNFQRTWGECRINIDPAGVWHGEGFDSKNGIGELVDGMEKKCSSKKNMLTGRVSAVYKDTIEATIDFVKRL